MNQDKAVSLMENNRMQDIPWVCNCLTQAPLGENKRSGKPQASIDQGDPECLVLEVSDLRKENLENSSRAIQLL